MFDESGGLNKLVEGKDHIKTGGGILLWHMFLIFILMLKFISMWFISIIQNLQSRFQTWCV